MPISRTTLPLLRMLLALLLASVSRSLVAPRVSGGYSHRGISLLQQRWAIPPNPEAVELSGAELTTYIATGRLPAHALVKLPKGWASMKTTANKSSEDAKNKTLTDYEKKADKILGQMKSYVQKLDTIRKTAQETYVKFTDQEKRLSANFLNTSTQIDGLIQKAAHRASKAEVQTMLERLQRIHYKQIGTLDRSATYWLEVADKEKEATRVAKARSRLFDAKKDSKGSFAQRDQMQKAATEEKAELDEWFKEYWAGLEESEKDALREEASLQEQKKPCDQPQAAIPAVQEEVVTPGAIVPNSFVVESNAAVDVGGQ